MLIVSLMIGAVIVSVKGDATWSGHRPTTSDFTYRNAPNGPVTVHDTYGQSDATVSLAVENYRYYRNWNGNPNYDAYVLNILGSANTRVAHKWSIEKYENDWFPCPGASTTCQDAGLKNKNQGAWYNLSVRMAGQHSSITATLTIARRIQCLFPNPTILVRTV